MGWDFETEAEFQEKLDWADQFVRDEVEPLDFAFPHLQFVPLNDARRKVVDPLKDEVRHHDLWATHLGPELGGQGYGQLKLALLNEILGRSPWASTVFGTQAPDTGNAEIIAHYGTPEQKERYLQPLLDGEMFSSYSMTEPHAGPDPPRDAHHRAGAEGAGHDVRARVEPADSREPAGREAIRAGLYRRLLRAARAVPAVRALHRVVDRQVQRLQEGAQGHRHLQG